MADNRLTRVPVTMMDSIPVEEATVDTVGGSKLGSLETLIAGDDEGRVVPQSLVRQLLGDELEWKRLPASGSGVPNPPVMSFGNGRIMMATYNSSTTQMFTADNRGETLLPRTAVTALAHMAANHSPRFGMHFFMSNSTSFRYTYDGDTWTIGTTTIAPTNMGFTATCLTRNNYLLFFAANAFYWQNNAASVTAATWTSSWTGTTAAAHNDATGTTISLGYGSSTVGAYIMRAVNDTTTFTRTLALPFAMTQANSHKLTCGNGIFVGVVTGTNCVFRSTDDGVTWTARGLPDGQFIQDIAFGDGKFVIATSYNCLYVYVSTDGESWTTVPLPTVSYSSVIGSWVTFYNGDFYVLRPSRPVGRDTTTSWFLRRKASTIPAIGDPIVPSTWSSFTISTVPVIVPEGFNTLNHPGTHASYALYRNRYELIASTSTPAGSIAVQPGDAIFVSGLTIAGCSFTYELLPPVTLTWGAGDMATGTQVDLQPYIDQGYTKATYVETSPASVSNLAVVTPSAPIIAGIANSVSEGSFTLASIAAVGNMIRATYSSGGSVVLTLTEGTAPDWNGTANGRREYFKLADDNIVRSIMGSSWTNSSTTSMLTSFWYADIYARGQNQDYWQDASMYYQINSRASYDVLTWSAGSEMEQSTSVTQPLYTGYALAGQYSGNLSPATMQVVNRYKPRLYVENAIEMALPASYVVPAGINTMHLRLRTVYSAAGGVTVHVYKNGSTVDFIMSETYDMVKYGTYAVQPGDVITVTKNNASYAFADAIFAGRGSFVDMTPISASPATTMPAIGVAPVQPVPVVVTVEEGENLGANYPIAEPADWSKRSFKLRIDATGKFPRSDIVTVPYDYKYVKGHITGTVAVKGTGTNAIPRTGGYGLLRSKGTGINTANRKAGEVVTKDIDGEYNYDNPARTGKRDVYISDLHEGHWSSMIMELTFFNEEEV